jgi:hypothetical protein
VIKADAEISARAKNFFIIPPEATVTGDMWSALVTNEMILPLQRMLEQDAQ